MEKERTNVFQNLESIGKGASSFVIFVVGAFLLFSFFRGDTKSTDSRYLIESGKGYYEFPQIVLKDEKLLGIDLSYNAIDSIPPEITKLSHLQLIDLSHNLLNDIAKEICDLKDLKSLNVANNRLQALPDFTKCEKLTEISIAGNEFKEFPIGLSKAPALEALDISQNNLQLTAEAISPLQHLKVLKLSQSQLPLAEQTKLQQTNQNLKIEFINKSQ